MPGWLGLVAFHRRRGNCKHVVRIKNKKRRGTGATSEFVNAGRMFSAAGFSITSGKGWPVSERDLFPGILGRGLFAVEQHGVFIDIGTSEGYARAPAPYETLCQATGNKKLSSLTRNG